MMQQNIYALALSFVGMTNTDRSYERIESKTNTNSNVLRCVHMPKHAKYANGECTRAKEKEKERGSTRAFIYSFPYLFLHSLAPFLRRTNTRVFGCELRYAAILNSQIVHNTFTY